VLSLFSWRHIISDIFILGQKIKRLFRTVAVIRFQLEELTRLEVQDLTFILNECDRDDEDLNLSQKYVYCLL